MRKEKSGFITWLENASKGDEFFSNQSDKSLTGCAYRLGYKITAHRWIAIHPLTKEVRDITRVVFIQNKNQID